MGQRSRNRFIPETTWSRRFSAPEPSASAHSFSRPPVVEAMSLLPIAYRVASYINNERNKGSEPIFDLSGILLEPPKPGPHAGVPLGGLGGGCIGRGFKGEFRRWSLSPGRYVHRIVKGDVFCLRVQRGDKIHSKVLSIGQSPDQDAPMGSWNWCLPASCGTYHALYPRSWTVYENPVPDITVVIEQLSPFLPDSYSEASMPCATFHIDVSNTDPTTAADVSIMFCFQNGYSGGVDCTACKSGSSCTCSEYSSYDVNENEKRPSDLAGGLRHCAFSVPVAHNTTLPCEERITGVCMTRPTVSVMRLANTTVSCSYCGRSTSESAPTDTEPTTLTTTPTDTLSSDSPIDTPTTAINETASEGCEYCSRTGLSSFSIAAHTSAADKSCATTKVSTCVQFVTDIVTSSDKFSWLRFLNILKGGGGPASQIDPASSSQQLWEQFCQTGDISDVGDASSKEGVSQPGTRVGAAVCLRKHLEPAGSVGSAGGANSASHQIFPFSLSWDDPYVRFGAKGKFKDSSEDSILFPRYYTRFFGTSGLASPQIAAYALLHCKDWRNRICSWQERSIKTATDSSPSAQAKSYFDSQLFNELYFLADGGTVWTDSAGGVSNQLCAEVAVKSATYSKEKGDAYSALSRHPRSSQDSLLEPLTEGADHSNATAPECLPVLSLQRLKRAFLRISADSIKQIHDSMHTHDSIARCCSGDQKVVGQFLYLEGHEYLMYNTYDVHFYASFALLMLWPQLELSLQRDFVAAVSAQDPSTRVMMGTGEYRPRKVEDVVPHDLGSPSESPWRRTNAYNFQDVSRWKDLGPKFILQIYRDYIYLISRPGITKQAHDGLEKFLEDTYPVMRRVMKSTALFDTDGDGMIENAGFPDQTYDIWTATGVHAYCGGLWIAACEAMVNVATKQRDSESSSYYSDLASRARAVYVQQLWNGRYLNYDSSASEHHDSIMADMMAGQWYARACNLPGVVSQRMALSCFREIFCHNVLAFGDGKLIGAVNGMRPPPSYDTSTNKALDSYGCEAGGAKAADAESVAYSLCTSTASSAAPEDGQVDNSCMQSREVWTGTTYALAAAMIAEATHHVTPNNTHAHTHLQHGELTSSERDELQMMAHRTAQGIHDGGWQEFGYWFATPEGWEGNGNYRSLGYMRALGIWAMQYAKEVHF